MFNPVFLPEVERWFHLEIGRILNTEMESDLGKMQGPAAVYQCGDLGPVFNTARSHVVQKASTGSDYRTPLGKQASTVALSKIQTV